MYVSASGIASKMRMKHAKYNNIMLTGLLQQGWRKQFYIGQVNQSSMHNFQL